VATLTTKNAHTLVLPFLTKYYGTGSVQPTDEPLDTITTKDRFGLAMVSLAETMKELGVVDIGFRMLDVDELARAQGFPEGYYLHGTKAEQVKQVGNAVCPPVAKALCETIAEAA
jgi:DNA (cytosine-5)-methyltransferase 1